MKAYDCNSQNLGFHSINVPSEWGHPDTENPDTENPGFHSINVPSEWGRKYFLFI